MSLIAKCVTTDNRHAFGQLVEAYEPFLKRFLLNLTLGDEMLSDDLAQETFIKAYLSLKSWRGMARFGTWLYRIACNEYYQHLRARRPLSPIDDVAVAVDCHSASEAAVDVERMMAELSAAERTAVLLFYLEEHPVKEVAVIMDIPQGSVKSHLSRARVKMAKLS